MTFCNKVGDKIATSDIIFDESIYPREKIDHKRVSIFAENLRENVKFDPIVVQIHPKKKGKYRILDGVHRWNAHKEVGLTDIQVIIIDLEGMEPLLYAAKMAIGPKQLTENETRDVIRRHLGEMPSLAKSPNTDLSRGLTIPQVAARHGWSEPMLWSLALEGQNDQTRFKNLGWGLRTWDLWNFNSDWRDFQSCPALKEDAQNAILLTDY